MFLFCKAYSFAENSVIVVRISIKFWIELSRNVKISNSLITLFSDVSSFVSTVMYLDPLYLLSLEFVERKIAWWSDI